MSCGAWNGVENEATKVVQEMAEKMTVNPDSPSSPVMDTGQRHLSNDKTDEVAEAEDDDDRPIARDEVQDSEDDSDREDTTNSERVTRSKAKQTASED